MRRTRVEFCSGELSLEGVLTVPEGAEPLPAIVICHPHPLYGGSMDNNVVNSLSETLAKASLISLRFNFRGVGASQGSFGHGVGEQEDVEAALSFISILEEVNSERIGLVGYSAGASFAFPVAFKDGRVKALAAISPPLSMFDFKFLKGCLKPKLLISGGMDDFSPVEQFLEFCQTLPDPREFEVIEETDHFWWGYELGLAAKVAAFFAKEL